MTNDMNNLGRPTGHDTFKQPNGTPPTSGSVRILKEKTNSSKRIRLNKKNPIVILKRLEDMRPADFQRAWPQDEPSSSESTDVGPSSNSNESIDLESPTSEIHSKRKRHFSHPLVVTKQTKIAQYAKKPTKAIRSITQKSIPKLILRKRKPNMNVYKSVRRKPARPRKMWASTEVTEEKEEPQAPLSDPYDTILDIGYEITRDLTNLEAYDVVGKLIDESGQVMYYCEWNNYTGLLYNFE